jgi:positive regulator of sigma E activity
MNRTVTVIETGERLLVKNDDVPSAKSSSSRRFWGVTERAYPAANPSGLAVTAGDTVEIFLPPGRTVLSSLLMFLLPLALFPAGYALSGLIPGAGEGLRFLIGFASLLAGLPAGALLNRIVDRLSSGGTGALPRIIRVLSPAEALSCRLKAGDCGSCRACG